MWNISYTTSFVLISISILSDWLLHNLFLSIEKWFDSKQFAQTFFFIIMILMIWSSRINSFFFRLLNFRVCFLIFENDVNSCFLFFLLSRFLSKRMNFFFWFICRLMFIFEVDLHKIVDDFDAVFDVKSIVFNVDECNNVNSKTK